jgi:hypothetical protein
MNLLHKTDFCQAHCVEWFKSIHIKFISYFLDTPTSFNKFWKFVLILGIKSIEKRLINATQCRASNRATACGARAKMACLRGTVACCTRAKPAQPGRAGGPRRGCHALGAVTAQRACPGRHDGASVGGLDDGRGTARCSAPAPPLRGGCTGQSD